ncbi:Gfo/Idh/MocA family protein [Longitalea arenae]|uniref:Gfo/Idh/MocA family protein n=1 Tax=Longitalea arenae TaxID=2812558 RepID=UPI00196833A5|nr:Gfo/Idh/MocA family oxidoreductase [Longitalea arenae]
MKKTFLTLTALAFMLPVISQQPLKVGVAGLSHDHALGLMHQYKNGKVIILGIAEADTILIGRYKRRFQLPDSIFYPSLVVMLQKIRPDAVLAYNPVYQHIDVVEASAPKGISVMVEKPLATTVAQANRMAELAHKYNIHVLTNYETTWYASNQQLYQLVQSNRIGDVRRMVVHDGHEGPKEIGCSKEFLQWLTDPVKNGGGAITDFGCYGANLMTWLMKGKAPVAVTAVTHQIKPHIYPKVDDDATIVLDYGHATGIIEASWNWPFSIKDWEVFGTSGYLHALNPNTLQQRLKNSYDSVPQQQPVYTDNLQYLSDVLHGKVQPGNDLSSLENNIIVVRILEAAKRSAREGKRVVL